MGKYNKFCEVCGRPIKTGRKYCWEHRKSGGSGYNSHRGDIFGVVILFVMVGFGVYYLLSNLWYVFIIISAVIMFALLPRIKNKDDFIYNKRNKWTFYTCLFVISLSSAVGVGKYAQQQSSLPIIVFFLVACVLITILFLRIRKHGELSQQASKYREKGVSSENINALIEHRKWKKLYRRYRNQGIPKYEAKLLVRKEKEKARKFKTKWGRFGKNVKNDFLGK